MKAFCPKSRAGLGAKNRAKAAYLAIAALRAAGGAARQPGLREGVDQRVGVAGEADAGREASATTSPAPPVRLPPWRCEPPPWSWANCCWAACSPTLVWPSEMPACASACAIAARRFQWPGAPRRAPTRKRRWPRRRPGSGRRAAGPGLADPGAARRSAPRGARCCSSPPVAGPGRRPSAWRRRAWRPAARPAADRCRRVEHGQRLLALGRDGQRLRQMVLHAGGVLGQLERRRCGRQRGGFLFLAHGLLSPGLRRLRGLDGGARRRARQRGVGAQARRFARARCS